MYNVYNNLFKNLPLLNRDNCNKKNASEKLILFLENKQNLVNGLELSVEKKKLFKLISDILTNYASNNLITIEDYKEIRNILIRIQEHDISIYCSYLYELLKDNNKDIKNFKDNLNFFVTQKNRFIVFCGEIVRYVYAKFGYDFNNQDHSSLSSEDYKNIDLYLDSEEFSKYFYQEYKEKFGELQKQDNRCNIYEYNLKNKNSLIKKFNNSIHNSIESKKEKRKNGYFCERKVTCYSEKAIKERNLRIRKRC